MKIALDAMGGDHAPRAQTVGAMRAVQEFSELEITLIGDEQSIRSHLSNEERISIIHTTEKIEDTDKPTHAVRRKKDASMVLAVREVKEGRADACISSGNTGALMTAGLLHVGRIKGVDRPALAPMLPTMGGSGFLLLDVGANMDAKPQHLLQHAVIGSTYMQLVKNVSKPRVGLLNVGTESGKGNELTKATFPLLEQSDLNFIGNVEARDLLEGVADVVVCDGFSGNLVLKTIEGTAASLFGLIKQELTKSVKNKLAAEIIKPTFRDIKTQMSYSEYGGAGLFGLRSPVIKAHGSSDETAIFHAIRQAKLMVEQQVAALVKAELAKMPQAEEEKGES